MFLGKSKTNIFFDQTKFDLAYVATGTSGRNINLSHYKIGFYRLTYKDIAHIHSLESTNKALIFIAVVIIGTFVLCASYMFIQKMLEKKRAQAKLKLIKPQNPKNKKKVWLFLFLFIKFK